MPQKTNRMRAGERNEKKAANHKGGGHKGSYLGVRDPRALYGTPLTKHQAAKETRPLATILPTPRRRKGTPTLGSVEALWFAVLRLLVLRANNRGRVPEKQALLIARSIGLGISSLNRVARLAMAGKSLARKTRSGESRLVKSEWMKEWFRAQHKKWHGKWTVRAMTTAMKEEWGGAGSMGSVVQIAKECGYRMVAPRLLPVLGKVHLEKRVEFARFLTDAKSPLQQSDTFIGMLDEKWFVYRLLQKSVWVEKDEDRPTYFIKNKQHQTKVMFLGALGMPRPAHGFDGGIGLFPIGDLELAKKSSANRPAGASVFKTKEMDRGLTVKMLKDDIIPATLNKCGWAKRIIWVLDNAGGHGGGRGDMTKTTLDPLNEWCKTLPPHLLKLCADPKHPPEITFMAQSPHSPDMNVLDNGAWWSLQVTVDKLNAQHGGVSTPAEIDVCNAVVDAWQHWVSAANITKLFNSVVINCQKVIDTHGGNSYKQPHHRDVNHK